MNGGISLMNLSSKPKRNGVILSYLTNPNEIQMENAEPQPTLPKPWKHKGRCRS